MMNASIEWGIELKGGELDTTVWKDLLRPPHDPFVEQVHGVDSSYMVLRSSAFDGLATPSEVFGQAKGLFVRLNMAMAANADVDPVSLGPVVEFRKDGAPRRHRRLEAESGSYRVRGGVAELTHRDAHNGKVERPSVASEPQNWMRAAALHPGVAAAMTYLSGNPGWVDLYKAHEALRDGRLAPDAISASTLSRFTQTANAGERHREGKYDPHPNPMPLWEARSLLITRLVAAIDEVLSGAGG
jgi:hypothetical protein